VNCSPMLSKVSKALLPLTSLLTAVTEIDIPVAQSTAVSTVKDALQAAETIGYPVILRSAFTLGGLGSGFATNPDELRDLSAKSLSLSPQVLIERSMKGWKELEYEVVRDGADVSLLLCFCLPCLTRR
jgi:carbamoyl-phosphate synthase large subunit